MIRHFKGTLHDYCGKHKLGRPLYECIEKNGKYQYKCIVGCLSFCSEAFVSKREASHESARIMYKNLRKSTKSQVNNLRGKRTIAQERIIFVDGDHIGLTSRYNSHWKIRYYNSTGIKPKNPCNNEVKYIRSNSQKRDAVDVRMILDIAKISLNNDKKQITVISRDKIFDTLSSELGKKIDVHDRWNTL